MNNDKNKKFIFFPNLRARKDSKGNFVPSKKAWKVLTSPEVVERCKDLYEFGRILFSDSYTYEMDLAEDYEAVISHANKGAKV